MNKLSWPGILPLARCILFVKRDNPTGGWPALQPEVTAMKKSRGIPIVLAMCVLLISVPLFAHHSGSAFDLEHPVTLKGTVVSYEWSNPHVFIGLDVKDDKGEVEQWRIEANSPNMLTRVGWKKDMIKEGDQLAVTGFLAKTGRKIMRLHSLTLANGQQFDGEGFK
jgi:hypothetical protein